MTTDDRRVREIHRCMKRVLELCETEVIIAQKASRHDDIMAIIEPMTSEVGHWWEAFREKWGIPECPLERDEMPMGAELRQAILGGERPKRD